MDLATTLSAISSAKDFAALLINRKLDSVVTEKAIELQNSIIALQSSILAMQGENQSLVNEKRALAEELQGIKNWETEVERHHLQAVAKGVYVVHLKPEFVQGSAPWYCANCFEKRFKSVLQRRTQDYGGTHYYCPNCKAEVHDHSDRASIG